MCTTSSLAPARRHTVPETYFYQSGLPQECKGAKLQKILDWSGRTRDHIRDLRIRVENAKKMK